MKRTLGLLFLIVVLSLSSIQVFAEDDPEGGVIHDGGIISCEVTDTCPESRQYISPNENNSGSVNPNDGNSGSVVSSAGNNENKGVIANAWAFIMNFFV